MLPLIGMAAGLLPQIFGLGAASKQRRAAAKLQREADARFNVADQSGRSMITQSLNNYQGRMAGAGQAQANVYQNQANTLASAGRNATDASQLLAVASGVQGNTNNAFSQLGAQEAQDKQARFGQTLAAQQAYQNLNLERASQLGQAASQNGQASQQNQFNALNGLGNLGMMVGMGQFGTFGTGQGRMASYTGSVQNPNIYNPNQPGSMVNVPAPQMRYGLPINYGN